MSARASQAKIGVLHKLYQTFVDDVLQQRRDIPHVSLTASTKRADESLRRAAEFETRVSQNISITDRTEENEKALQGLFASFYKYLLFYLHFVLPLSSFTFFFLLNYLGFIPTPSCHANSTCIILNSRYQSARPAKRGLYSPH